MEAADSIIREIRTSVAATRCHGSVANTKHFYSDCHITLVCFSLSLRFATLKILHVM